MELLILGGGGFGFGGNDGTFYLGARRKFFSSGGQGRKVYVDTSALMDSRLLGVAETGFMGDDLIIPKRN